MGHSVSNHPKKRENETPPLPILLKFGVWDYQAWRRRYFNFWLDRTSGFRDMTHLILAILAKKGVAVIIQMTLAQ